MQYLITLVLTSSAKSKDEETIEEITNYILEKEGKVIDSKTIGQRSIALGKKGTGEAEIHRFEIELIESEISKLKRKIRLSSDVISFILEKKKIFKVKPVEEIKTKSTKKAPNKRKEDQAGKVLDSIVEEEKKIKDLDSTLDKLLNE
jgi:ribosomal protein S6